MTDDEINRAMHEALGKPYPGEDWICPDDYTTDPRLFWPLLIELAEYYDHNDFLINVLEKFGISGRNVCLAWLKMKEVECPNPSCTENEEKCKKNRIGKI